MPNTPRYCTQCGAQLGAGVKFCSGCGSAVPGAAPTQAAAAGRPQAVIPKSAVSGQQSASAQRPGPTRQAPSRPSQQGPSTATSSTPVNIVINGSQLPASQSYQYSGYQGYRCATCGSALYRGGPSCGCGWGFADFAALGFEAMAIGDLFAGDVGGAMTDFVIAGALEGGGYGYAPYGGGMYGMGGFAEGLLLADAISDDYQLAADQQEIAYQQGEIDQLQQDQGGYDQDDQGQYDDQGYQDQGYQDQGGGYDDQSGYDDQGGYDDNFGGGDF